MANKGGSYRRAGTALYVTMAAAFLIIAALTAMALFFKVTEIEVRGQAKYTSDEIVAASGIEPEDSIFFVSTRDAEIGIKNALPYVDSVKVSRKLPGSVVISVTESVAEVSVEYGGSVWLMDRECRVLEKTDEAGAVGTIEVRGVAPSEPEAGKDLELEGSESVRLSSLKSVLEKIFEEGFSERVAWIDVSNLSTVTFDYNGYRVNIGRADDLDTKFDLLEKFTARYPEAGSGQEVIYDEKNRGLNVGI